MSAFFHHFCAVYNALDSELLSVIEMNYMQVSQLLLLNMVCL